MISNIVDTGLRGLTKSLQSAEQTANDIAKAGNITESSMASEISNDPAKFESGESSGSDLSSSLVELKLYEQSFAASARVISVGDALLGTLLDTSA